MHHLNDNLHDCYLQITIRSLFCYSVHEMRPNIVKRLSPGCDLQIPPDDTHHSPHAFCNMTGIYPLSFLNCFRGLLHRQKTYLRISFSCLSSPLRQSPSLASCKFCSFNCPTSVSSCAIFSSFLILKVQL